MVNVIHGHTVTIKASEFEREIAECVYILYSIIFFSLHRVVPQLARAI